MRYISVTALNALAVKAMDAGCYPAQHRDNGLFGRRIEWDVSGRCQSPVVVELHARYDVDPRKRVKPWWIFLSTKCRKCENCRRERATMWRQRALQEYRATETRGARTWLCTLTYAPEYRAQLLQQAMGYAVLRGVNFDELPEAEKFSAIVAETGRHFDLFGKRLRGTRPPVKYRYLWISEPHPKSGYVHFHGLIHEWSSMTPLRKARIQRAWTYGFSNVSLVKSEAAALYVTKYISKEVSSRVRASNRYGDFALQNVDAIFDRRLIDSINRGDTLIPSSSSNYEMD